MKMPRMRITLALAVSFISSTATAQDNARQGQLVLHIYGPGGPLPAMKEAAEAFGKEKRIQVSVVGGPTSSWIQDAREHADLIYSGSEQMMSDFQIAMQGGIEPASITPLYLRKAAILVRPGNPGHIAGLPDLLKPGHHILVVNGAGQSGLWEDIAGRLGDIASVRQLRANISVVASNSGEARAYWINNKELDAWLVWNIWQVSNPTLADAVQIDEPHQIYRDCGIGLTVHGKTHPAAREFIDFLLSPAGARIFRKWGWIAE